MVSGVYWILDSRLKHDKTNVAAFIVNPASINL